MASGRSWTAFPITYRAREMQTLAAWIAAGVSGSVVGPAGAGKSNLLGFLTHRPEALTSYLPPGARPVVAVPVDLNDLPSLDIATLHRLILRSFHEIGHRLDPAMEREISDLYGRLLSGEAARDPFQTQSALRELLTRFCDREAQVVLVLDHFDRFCRRATPDMFNTLRGLRDSFKATLSYIVGVRQEISRQFCPADLGEMYELLDTHLCWVGPLSDPDARQMIVNETSGIRHRPDEAAMDHLVALTGGYPALLKAACHWWRNAPDRPAVSAWRDLLLAQPSIRSRLEEMLEGLTEGERSALTQIQNRIAPQETRLGLPSTPAGGELSLTLSMLGASGLCSPVEGGWRVNGELLGAYLASSAGGDAGRIWLDERTGELCQGRTPLRDLTPLARSVLGFLVRHPGVQHTKTDLIVNAWPDEPCREGVSDASVYQVIRELRARIEPDPSEPRHIITWRGYPEGGYQFFAEGRPGGSG
jgi:DNA-binding winged helix-turn-helix (wHTH) protein